MQGEPPDNMRRFWRLLLRKSLPPTALAGLAYAAFGLGDSGYLQYNVRLGWLSGDPGHLQYNARPLYCRAALAACAQWCTRLWLYATLVHRSAACTRALHASEHALGQFCTTVWCKLNKLCMCVCASTLNAW